MGLKNKPIKRSKGYMLSSKRVAGSPGNNRSQAPKPELDNLWISLVHLVKMQMAHPQPQQGQLAQV